MSQLTTASAPNPKAVGEVSEAFVLARLIELGYSVALPFGNNQRYDFIVDDGSALRRMQVKTGRLRDGRILFSTNSVNGFTGEHRGYLGEADDFLVYCAETNEIYRVPVDECGHLRHGSLRFLPRQTSSKTAVRWAADYVFDEHLTTPKGRKRKPRPERFPACDRNHPGVQSRVKQKVSRSGHARWYCADCNAASARRCAG